MSFNNCGNWTVKCPNGFKRSHAKKKKCNTDKKCELLCCSKNCQNNYDCPSGYSKKDNLTTSSNCNPTQNCTEKCCDKSSTPPAPSGPTLDLSCQDFAYGLKYILNQFDKDTDNPIDCGDGKDELQQSISAFA